MSQNLAVLMHRSITFADVWYRTLESEADIRTSALSYHEQQYLPQSLHNCVLESASHEQLFHNYCFDTSKRWTRARLH